MGGKALTNYLKEAVSYRQYNMMDDTFLVNQVKERLCYVSQARRRMRRGGVRCVNEDEKGRGPLLPVGTRTGIDPFLPSHLPPFPPRAGL